MLFIRGSTTLHRWFVHWVVNFLVVICHFLRHGNSYWQQGSCWCLPFFGNCRKTSDFLKNIVSFCSNCLIVFLSLLKTITLVIWMLCGQGVSMLCILSVMFYGFFECHSTAKPCLTSFPTGPITRSSQINIHVSSSSPCSNARSRNSQCVWRVHQ